MSSIFSGHRLNNDKKDPTGTFTVGFLFYCELCYLTDCGGGVLNVKFVIYIRKKQYIRPFYYYFLRGEFYGSIKKRRS